MKVDFKSFMLGALVASIVSLFNPFMTSAHAHTLNAEECAAFAHDALLQAKDRDAGMTYKIAVEELAQGLQICTAKLGPTCIYKDDADGNEILSTLGWVFANPTMTPAQIHDKVKGNCEERLVESLRAEHGVK